SRGFFIFGFDKKNIPQPQLRGLPFSSIDFLIARVRNYLEFEMPKPKKPKSARRSKLMNRYESIGELPPINPDFLYRLAVVPLYLGIELSQVYQKIRDKELLKPVQLSASGRAVGYYGSTLLEIKAKRIAEAKAA